MSEDAQNQQPTIRTVDVEAEEIQNFQVPAYVNFVNVPQFRADVFIDMGLITIEQMTASRLDAGSDVKVAMYDRFVMSLTTFDEMLTQMTRLRDHLKSQGI